MHTQNSKQKKVKAVVISLFYTPEPIGISKYTGEMATWFANHGLDVRVVTAFPFYPQWRPYPGYSRWRFQSEWLDQVRVIRCPLWVPRRVNGLKRILHLLSFGFTSSLATISQLFWKPDVVFLIIPAMVNIPAATILSKLAHSCSWLHVQDFEFDLAQDLDILPGAKRIFKWIQKAEQWLFRPYSKVSTISNKMVDRLINEKQVPQSQSYLLPNWVDCQEIYPLDRASSFREALNISSETIVALYSGNMGRKYGLEGMAEVAKRFVNHSEVMFVFCGNGVAREDLEDACEGLPNVLFLPLQPMDKLNDLLNLADIHLLPQKANAADSVMPSKLLGILASGRPVIATVHRDSEIANVIDGCGMIVPPDDLDAFEEALVLLAKDASKRYAMGKKGRGLAVQRYGKEEILNNLLLEIM